MCPRRAAGHQTPRPETREASGNQQAPRCAAHSSCHCSDTRTHCKVCYLQGLGMVGFRSSPKPQPRQTLRAASQLPPWKVFEPKTPPLRRCTDAHHGISLPYFLLGLLLTRKPTAGSVTASQALPRKRIREAWDGSSWRGTRKHGSKEKKKSPGESCEQSAQRSWLRPASPGDRFRHQNGLETPPVCPPTAFASRNCDLE